MPLQDPNLGLEQELENLQIDENGEENAPAAAQAATDDAALLWRYQTPPPAEQLTPRLEATPAEFFYAQGALNRRNETLLQAIANKTITPAQVQTEQARIDAAQQRHDTHKSDYKRSRYTPGSSS